MAMLLRPDGTTKNVKNLGWLLRHWKTVKKLSVVQHAGFIMLYAQLEDQTVYGCRWCDENVLWKWLHRPVFDGMNVKWGSQTFKIENINQYKPTPVLADGPVGPYNPV